MSKTQKITRELQKISTLPPLPEVATRVLALINDPESSAKELATLVRRDAALATHLLKVANSAAYGLTRRVTSIELALVVLGFDEVRNLVISIAILRAFPSKSKNQITDEYNFWMHSISCAIAARELANEISFGEGEPFLAGLLHDIGLLAAEKFFNDKYRDTLKLSSEENISIYKAEKKIFGMGHDELGARLAEHWNLPEPICNVIRYHHQPSLDPDKQSRPLCALVHLAEIFSKSPDIKAGEDIHGTEVVDENAWQILADAYEKTNSLDLYSFFKNIHIQLEHERGIFEQLLKLKKTSTTRSL